MTMAAAVMPAELKEAGWKLERKVVNDDEDHPLFIARNEGLGQGTGEYKDIDGAIEGAVTLHLRSQGKKVSRREIRRFVKDMSSDKDAKAESDETAVTLQKVAFSKIRRDGGTQPRPELDQPTVDRYAEDKKNGAKFPPGIVFFDGKNHWLARGFHRTAADEKNGLRKAEFEVRQGTQREAILFSFGENHDHGLPRTNDEKRRAVRRMLEDSEWSHWSDGAIAQTAKVSPPFVGKLRRELTQNVLSEKPASASKDARAPQKPQPTKRIGKDQVARETKRIGKKKDVSRSALSAGKDARAPAPANGSKVEDYPEGWFDQQISINLVTKPGTMARRPLTVSGKVGAADPVFLNFTSNDLNPMPPALAELFAQLLKGYRKLMGKASSAKGGRK